MEYNKLEHFLSKPRLDRFLIATTNSKSRAQKLYRANLRLAQAFYPILNLFEIFIRNAVNNSISAFFSDPDWIIHQPNGFMSSPSLYNSRYYLRESILKAIRAISRKGGVVTSGKIIAEQTLGFWTSLFEVHHYSLLGGSPIHAFPNKPPTANRSVIASKLNKIREFRNRIYHNEPICFSNSPVVDFNHVTQIRSDIYDLLQWMDADLSGYVKYFDSINQKVILANKI